MNDAAVVDWNIGNAPGPRNIPANLIYTDSLYWKWNDARWIDWGVDFEELKYPINDLWEKLIRQAGFSGEVYQPKIYQIQNEWGFWEDAGTSGLTYTPAAKSAIDGLRARGFDLARKHPDRRTYNTYWGLFTPDGKVQDIKIEGDDGAGNLLKIALFMSPVWAGPLASLLNVPTPVVSAGIKLATGADPGKVLVSTLAPIAVDAVLPSVSVLPDTSIGPILPPAEWLDAPFAGPVMPGFDVDPGFVVPTLPVAADTVTAAELLTAPALLPELDPIETLGPSIEPPPPTVQVEAEPIPGDDEMTTWQERAAAMRARFGQATIATVEAPTVPIEATLEPVAILEPVAPPPEPIVYRGEPFWRQWGIVNPFAADPYASLETPAAPVEATPAPVVELPAIETMAPIPTIDAAPPTIEPVEVFTQPVEVPKMDDEFFWRGAEVEAPAFDVDFSDPFAGLEIPEFDVSIPEYGDDIYTTAWDADPIYGPPIPGETYPPAYDVVTVDDAAQLPADILVGGSGGGVVEVGGNFAPNPDPGNPGLSVGQVLRDANGIMLEALKLVDSYRRLVNPQPPNRVVQARVGSSTVRATPDGMIVTVDASGRTVRTKPPVGQPQMTTDGSMIVNNGDGTYTSISPSGAMATNRYPTTGAAASSNYTTPLLIGGAILAIVALTR